MTYETVQVRKLTGGCGAEVLGVDVTSMSNRQWGEVQQAFTEHGVIFFRDQSLTPEQHIDFARRWGSIDINRYFTPVAGHPEIAEVRKEPDQKRNIGEGWHTDHTYDAIPAMGSILVARELPSQGGGTSFANIYRAFETLSEGLKRTLRGMNAVHSSAHVFGTKARQSKGDDLTFHNGDQVGDVVHPVVIRHPLSGREALYVNPDFTIHFEGWSKEDSKPLLQHLYAHVTQPEFISRFQWKPGSIAFWDNRATWHSAANDYHGERRLMHRITVGGCKLEAAQKN
jgi:taurine dioxygenase